MKLLVNDKEIANYLASLLEFKNIHLEVRYDQNHINEAITYAVGEKEKGKGKWQKKKLKIKDKIKTGVEKDLREYMYAVKLHLQSKRKRYYYTIHKKINLILDRLDKNTVLENYKKSQVGGFVKSTGLYIDSTATIVRRSEFSDVSDDCVLRNTVGNEQFLIDKIDNNLPFWFIDSGYTNFIESNKKWHRIVHNHLHYGKFFDAPADRLGIFTTFPKKWKTTGDTILVIEPGEFAANIFHVDVTQWKLSVEQELRKYTDKKIVFREKAPKKKRLPLYKHLLGNNDYYCVISINSNAATEAIWAGIPVITLGKHISNPIAKSELSDINNLYRGPIASWLAMLSYSQFTYEELINGTAVDLVKQYHV